MAPTPTTIIVVPTATAPEYSGPNKSPANAGFASASASAELVAAAARRRVVSTAVAPAFVCVARPSISHRFVRSSRRVASRRVASVRRVRSRPRSVPIARSLPVAFVRVVARTSTARVAVDRRVFFAPRALATGAGHLAAFSASMSFGVAVCGSPYPRRLWANSALRSTPASRTPRRRSMATATATTATTARARRSGARVSKRATRVSKRAARRVAVTATSTAADALRDGRARYEAGDRMNGLKAFERALESDERMSLETRRELCYCAMCCSAAFGDVESAKMYLREMQARGLDFETAIADPTMMRMESSALMKNQLKKFAAGEGKSFGTVQREQYERDKANAAPTPATSVSGLRDLEISSDTDESVEAIVKRVGILIVLSAVGFVALFKGGMGIMEPGSLPFEEIY